MKLLKVIGILGAGAACVATGGLAAPAVGAFVGSTFMGLSGAAATSAGLAALGGGSLAAGGLGMAGGTMVVQAVAGGAGVLGAKLVGDQAELAQFRREQKELREDIQTRQQSDASKQKNIEVLTARIRRLEEKIAELEAQLDRNDEEIRVLKEELNELLETLEIAKAA